VKVKQKPKQSNNRCDVSLWQWHGRAASESLDPTMSRAGMMSAAAPEIPRQRNIRGASSQRPSRAAKRHVLAARRQRPEACGGTAAAAAGQQQPGGRGTKLPRSFAGP